MNELSWTTVIDLGAAPAQRGARAAAPSRRGWWSGTLDESHDGLRVGRSSSTANHRQSRSAGPTVQASAMYDGPCGRRPARGDDDMSSWSTVEQVLTSALGLVAARWRWPSATPHRPALPASRAREPSGCSFWRLASGGRRFYTVPADHYNCPIGSLHARDHAAAAARGRARADARLHGGHRVRAHGRGPGHSDLPKTPGVVVYAPLGDTPLDPDVVLIAGRPGG